MAYELIPGPRNPELLYLACQHRAMQIFYDSESAGNKPLTVRRCDLNFFEFVRQNDIHPRIRHYIRVAGFECVLDTGFHKVDHAVITSLVEVWRPETHTFHLKIGEATVTLQDVEVLWGLNVEGPVVTGQDNLNFDMLCELCQNFLGFTPLPGSVRGSCIKIKTLLENFKIPLSEEPTEIEFQQRARLCLMILIGGTLFSDTTATMVPFFYIYNLLDLEECRSLSWGSAVLAYLYRSLCRATKPQWCDISGPLVLLQLWAWERIRGFRPEKIKIPYKYDKAYGARY